MNERVCNAIRLVYKIVFAVWSVLVGALLIWQTLDVYLSGIAPDYTGEYIYSYERVAQALGKIAVPGILWLVLLLAGIVFWLVFPEREKQAFKRDNLYLLFRLKKRVPITVSEDLRAVQESVKKHDRILFFIRLFCILVCLVGAVYSVVYLANPAHFPKTDVTGEVLNMVKNVFPWVGVGMLLFCLSIVYEKLTVGKQLSAVKQLTAGVKEKVQKPHGKLYAFFHHEKFLLGVRIAVGCIGAAFVAWGIFNGGAHDVLIKAINICTECIGLG